MAGLIIILLVIAVVIGSIYYESKRTEELRVISSKLSLDFHDYLPAIVNDFQFFDLFKKGRDRSTSNVFVGEKAGFFLLCGDYSYSTGYGKNRRTYSYSFCIAQNKEVLFPKVYLRKENVILDSIGKVFGGQDINFNEDPQFSKNFVLQGENENEVRHLFNSEVRRSFLQFNSTNIIFECFDNAHIVYVRSRLSPKLREGFMKKTVSLGKILVANR